MRYTIGFMLVLVILCGQLPADGAPSFQATGTGRPSADSRVATLPGFTVYYPKRDWQPLVGAGSALVVFVHKTREATVAIERVKVELPLEQNEITDQTATLEGEDWQARRPLTSSFTHQIVDMKGGRVIVMDFTQVGAQGTERVRIFTLPRGSDWYRVICTTAYASFDKYKDTCQSIALSLTPSASQ